MSKSAILRNQISIHEATLIQLNETGYFLGKRKLMKRHNIKLKNLKKKKRYYEKK